MQRCLRLNTPRHVVMKLLTINDVHWLLYAVQHVAITPDVELLQPASGHYCELRCHDGQC